MISKNTLVYSERFGKASSKIFWEGNILTLSEQKYFVWGTAS